MTSSKANFRHTRTRTISWWIVIAAVSLIAVFTAAITREIVRTRQIRGQLAQLQSDVADEQTRSTELHDLIAYLSSPTFQEREARLQLGLKKSGERVIVVQPDERSGNVSGSSTTTVTSQTNSQQSANRWWQYFFPTQLDKPDQSS